MNKHYTRINWGCFFYLLLLLYAVYKINSIYQLTDSIFVMVIIEILIAYAVLALFFNVVIFYNDKIIQKFPLRIVGRKRVYFLSKIRKIKYYMPANYNMESIVLYHDDGNSTFIKIDSRSTKSNKCFFQWYHNLGIELDFIDIKHNTFDEINW